MNKKSLKASALTFFAMVALALFSYFIVSNLRSSTAFGDSSLVPQYSNTRNASTTCGQLATGQIVIGANSSSVSTATSSLFTIVVNGTVVTSTATATTTAASLANALFYATPTSTTSTAISASTSTDGNLIFINMTSTAWGGFVTLYTNTVQNGLSFSTSSTYPSTQIASSTGSRNFFSATYDTTSTEPKVYLCRGVFCALSTGNLMTTSSDPYIQTQADPYAGAYSCLSNTYGTSTASSSVLDYTISQ